MNPYVNSGLANVHNKLVLWWWYLYLLAVILTDGHALAEYLLHVMLSDRGVIG